MSEVWVKRMLKGPMHIRLAIKEDIKGIQEVDKKTMRSTVLPPMLEELLKKYIEEKQVYVAVFNGKIVGFSLFYDKGDVRYLTRSAVLAEFRRSRIYTAFILLKMLNSGKRKFVLTLDPDDTVLANFLEALYKRLGFLVERSYSSLNVRIPEEFHLEFANFRITELLREYGWRPAD